VSHQFLRTSTCTTCSISGPIAGAARRPASAGWREFVRKVLSQRGDTHVADRADRGASVECSETGDVDDAPASLCRHVRRQLADLAKIAHHLDVHVGKKASLVISASVGGLPWPPNAKAHRGEPCANSLVRPGARPPENRDYFVPGKPLDCSNLRIGATLFLISSIALATAVIVSGLHVPLPTVECSSECSTIA
jgi:hypothetical protein